MERLFIIMILKKKEHSDPINITSMASILFFLHLGFKTKREWNITLYYN